MYANSIVAIVSGQVANFAVHLFDSKVAPFDVAILCCAAAAYIIIKSNWAENTGGAAPSTGSSGGDAIAVMSSAVSRMVQQPQLFLLGFIQSLFESSMCATAFAH